MSERKVPKLRFPEFSDEWEKLTLIDITENGLTNGVFNDPKLVGSGYKLINVKDMFIEPEIDLSQLTLLNIEEILFNKNKVCYGDIFFTRSSLVKEGIAHSNIFLSRDNSVTYDGHLIKMTPNIAVVIPKFIHFLLKTRMVRKQLIVAGKTTTMTTIGQEEIASTNIFISNLSEQTEIAEFLTSVDDKIRQLTKKRELLEQYKKGVVQQIFSQKIRFKDDNGNEYLDWKKETLEKFNISVIDGDRGVNYPSSNDFQDSGYCLFLNAKNVTKNGFIFDELSFISQLKDEQLRKGKLNKYDIVLTTRGSVGNFAFFDKSVLFENIRINSGMVIIRNNNTQISNNYLYKYLKSSVIKNYINIVCFGSAQPQLTVSEINKLTILCPCLDEQTKIAHFLTSIDDKITQVNMQLEQTKLFKKSLLQQMFI